MKTSNKYLSICNVYILVWCLYNLQGPVFESGMVMQFLLVINLLISIYYAIWANTKYRLSDYFRALNILLLMFTIYGGILIISGEHIAMHGFASERLDNFTYLKNIYLSLLPIYPFYVFSREGILTENTIKSWLLLLIPMSTLLFIYRQQQAELMAVMSGSSRDEFTNNAGYMFLQLIPLIVFFRKRALIQYTLLAYCLLFILMGMKRGAIIIGVLCVLLFMWQSFHSGSRSQKYKFIALSLALLIAGVYAVQYFINTSDYFNMRIADTMEGNTSYRDDLYGGFIEILLSQDNVFNMILGNGANATIKTLGQYAHNDWIEIAVNQGLLGICVYAFYWVSFYRTWKKSPPKEAFSLALGLLFIIFFMKTLFSMSYADMEFFAAMTLGFSLYRNETHTLI